MMTISLIFVKMHAKKLNALARLAPFMNVNKRRIIMKAFIESHFLSTVRREYLSLTFQTFSPSLILLLLKNFDEKYEEKNVGKTLFGCPYRSKVPKHV